MDSITELNKLIYAGAKLIGDKLSVPLKNLNRKSKSGYKLRLEGQVKNWQQ